MEIKEFSSLTAKEKAIYTYKEIKKSRAKKKKEADTVVYGYLAENSNVMRKRNKRNNNKYAIRGK